LIKKKRRLKKDTYKSLKNQNLKDIILFSKEEK